jgi:hypothetical protein
LYQEVDGDSDRTRTGVPGSVRSFGRRTDR